MAFSNVSHCGGELLYFYRFNIGAAAMAESAADFKKSILDAHNKYRAHHGVPSVTWCNVSSYYLHHLPTNSQTRVPAPPTLTLLCKHSLICGLPDIRLGVWRQSCAANAQKAADACQSRSSLFHSNHDGQGQNVTISPRSSLTLLLTPSLLSVLPDSRTDVWAGVHGNAR